jgi:hypothetical protein
MDAEFAEALHLSIKRFTLSYRIADTALVT